MNHSEAGKGDAPRKQQDQRAYEEGWDRIFRKKNEDGELLGKTIKEESFRGRITEEENEND